MKLVSICLELYVIGMKLIDIGMKLVGISMKLVGISMELVGIGMKLVGKGLELVDVGTQADIRIVFQMGHPCQLLHLNLKKISHVIKSFCLKRCICIDVVRFS